MAKHRTDIRYVIRAKRNLEGRCHICGLLSSEVNPENDGGHKYQDLSVGLPLCTECQPGSTNAEKALKEAGIG